MNNDPLLVGVGSLFPNQNSSTAPAVWEEDTDQGAQQGIPSGSGPMLTLTKRSNNLAILPSGAANPAPEPNPQCLMVNNLRISPGAIEQLSASRLGSGLVGTLSSGGTLGARGIGVIGVGMPGDGVRGLALGPTPAGHGVFGQTNSSTLTDAGVMGVANFGGIGVQGDSRRGSGIGVHGVGGVVGVLGGNRTTVGTRVGVVGVSGPNFMIGSITLIPFAARFDGPVLIRPVGGAPGNLDVDGSLSVTGTKSALIAHPDGSHRKMYAVEAPDSWFEDVGRAQLHQGVARVEIDPDFAAVSGLSDDYHVFLTPEGPSNGLYVTDRSPGGFEVREQGEGNAEISFSYRIMTPRTDVRTTRLEPIELPSEAGVRATEPGEPQAVPSPAYPEEPGGVPPAERLPEGAVPEPPSDWPETVPWPLDIMWNRDIR